MTTASRFDKLTVTIFYVSLYETFLTQDYGITVSEVDTLAPKVWKLVKKENISFQSLKALSLSETKVVLRFRTLDSYWR